MTAQFYSRERRIEAFWSKTVPEPNSGCLLWLGARNNTNGYGYASSGESRLRGAHRLALEYSGQPCPKPDLCALHKCDVKLCVEPTHLYWGSDLENVRDMYERGQKSRRPFDCVRFGDLTALRQVGRTKRGQGLWLCRCVCGLEAEYRSDVLARGGRACTPRLHRGACIHTEPAKAA